MILRQFPDIEWLRRQALTNFADRRGMHGVALPESGWPSVVLNTRSHGTERRDIIGPFSVFANFSGKSIIRTEGLEFSIQADTYCITNHGEGYDLIIPEKSDTTTFNIHFGEKLFRETVCGLKSSAGTMLDQPQPEGNVSFQTLPRTVWKDREFKLWIAQMAAFYHDKDKYPSPAEDESERLSAFLEYILRCENRQLKAAQSIPSLKASTRRELMKRVLRAAEYIHDSYTRDVTLDDLSLVCGLSKFHLQRTFRQMTGRTPRQYIALLRMRKSCELIETTSMPISDIALATGFSELPAFSRFFLHQLNTYPAAYRKKLASLVK